MICVDCRDAKHDVCANQYRTAEEGDPIFNGKGPWLVSMHRGPLVKRAPFAGYDHANTWCDCQHKPRVKNPV